MFYHQKVARVRVFANIQNFALRAHCVHGIPYVTFVVQSEFTDLEGFGVDSGLLGGLL